MAHPKFIVSKLEEIIHCTINRKVKLCSTLHQQMRFSDTFLLEMRRLMVLDVKVREYKDKTLMVWHGKERG